MSPIPKARKGKFTDRELIAKCEKFRSLKSATAKAKAAEDKVKAEIVKELQARGTKVVEHGGVRVNLVSPEYVVYDETGLRTRLKKKWALVTSLVLDKDKLSAAVQAGDIDPKIVERYSEVKEKAPWPVVTDVD